MNEYITYGFDKFDKEKFKAEIETADLNDRKDKLNSNNKLFYLSFFFKIKT